MRLQAAALSGAAVVVERQGESTMLGRLTAERLHSVGPRLAPLLERLQGLRSARSIQQAITEASSAGLQQLVGKPRGGQAAGLIARRLVRC